MLFGSPTGFAKPVPLQDREGKRMHTGRYWDTDAKEHTSGDGPGGRAYSAFPIDWDADGDLDLLVGTDQGEFHLRINEGNAKDYAFATRTVPVTAGGMQATVGSYAMPVVADWDGDGRWDLISGNKDGAVHWFRNVGKKGDPRFKAARELTPASKRDGKGPQARIQVDVADFDGDGDLDLLVGDQSTERLDGKLVWHGWVWLYRRAGSPSQGER